jgi:hypothetical protein
MYVYFIHKKQNNYLESSQVILFESINLLKENVAQGEKNIEFRNLTQSLLRIYKI